MRKDSKVGHLMTYEEYANTEQSFPYFFEVRSNNQVIDYFGAEHSFNPHDDQMAKIEEAWRNFLSQVKKETALVLIEGGLREALENREESIKRDGEGGLVTHLAKQAGISIESPEPPLTHEVTELMKQFRPEEILYDYFARVATQWERAVTKQDMVIYVKDLIANEAEALGIRKENILTSLLEAHERIFGTELDLKDIEHFEKVCDPVNTFSVINKVARANSILRDLYILKEIEKKWNEGKSLFIVYGATHAIMQEPAVRELTK